MMGPMLRTDRLLIRPWKSEDLKDAARLWGDTQVMSLLGSVLSPMAIAERLAREIASQEQHGIQYWKVLAGESFVGCCGLKLTDVDGTNVVEMGFHLVPSCWGKGYATEAARAVLTYAFRSMRVSRVFAGHHPQNDASQTVLRKLGFVQQGERFYPPTGLNHPWYVLVNPEPSDRLPSRTS